VKKLGFVLFLIFGLSCITNAQEPQNATASKLPAPEDGEYAANDIGSSRAQFVGKVIKVKFNRIYYVQKQKTGIGMYAGNLRSWVKLQGSTYSDRAGIQIAFPKEGLGFFSKYIFKHGIGYDEWGGLMSSSDRAEVYVKIGEDRKAGDVALGDRYKKDDGEYEWSTETDIPDLASQREISVNDVALFPDQLNGKTVELVFYEAERVEQKSTEECSALISSGRGHQYIPITFPSAGKAYFKGIADQDHGSKAATVYATVKISPAGIVTLEAKGRRASGSDDDVTYKW
jgi:hypothetical protein